MSNVPRMSSTPDNMTPDSFSQNLSRLFLAGFAIVVIPDDSPALTGVLYAKQSVIETAVKEVLTTAEKLRPF